ncbi:aldehyde dehydrogenase family protein, partial [bacterium]|nr:aldehyde dehydrogenase family protein [bacterium]
VVAAAVEAFGRWRTVPAPRRGEIVRRIGAALRAAKGALGALVSLEMGKIRAEGEGEVQEMVDMADFSVGLSRQLHGLTMPSERPGHRLMEQWHPLGVVGVISAFNFPVAVWSWNALLALVCGDAVVWKPSTKTPLTAVAVTKLAAAVLEPEGFGALAGLAIGDRRAVGGPLVQNPRVPLVSATGSTAMGRVIARQVGERLGRTILELGGNNAIVVRPRADLDLAVRAILFGAVGTAGQRCTSTRRLLVDRAVAKPLLERLQGAYSQVRIGHQLDPDTLMGPLVDDAAVAAYGEALERIGAEGGEVVAGGRVLPGPGHYVEPTIILAPQGLPAMQEECFAPILYFVECDGFAEAMALHNGVPQGLSSAIFTADAGEAERFLAATGSDCGIANVNLGTSGAEIGGAFGGEKETGGGREAGSDAWKAYMRRQTNTINFSGELPLAQGIRFE